MILMQGTGWTVRSWHDIPLVVAVAVEGPEALPSLTQPDLPGVRFPHKRVEHIGRRAVAAGSFRTQIAIDPFNRVVYVEANRARTRGVATMWEWLAIVLYVERRA